MPQMYKGGFTINPVGSNSSILWIIRRVAVILILFYHDIRVYSITAAVDRMLIDTVKSR